MTRGSRRPDLFCACLVFCAVLLSQAEPACAGEAAPQTIAVGAVLRGHFVEDRHLAGFAKPLRSEGSFVLAPGTGLIWRGEKPFANTTVMSSGGIVQLTGNDEAVRVPAAQMPGLSRLFEVLGAALSGNVAPLRKIFAVAQTSGSEHWQIVLTPLPTREAAASQLKSLTLTGRSFVDSVDIERNGGDAEHIAFSEQAVSHADLTADEKALLQTLDR